MLNLALLVKPRRHHNPTLRGCGEPDQDKQHHGGHHNGEQHHRGQHHGEHHHKGQHHDGLHSHTHRDGHCEYDNLYG